MRPPLLWISVAFGAGLWAGLGFLGAWGVGTWGVVATVLVVARGVARQAPVGAAIGLMGVSGLLWGAAAVREATATCQGMWGRGAWGVASRAAIVRLADPAPEDGGLVEARVEGGRCGGALSMRWPASRPARGGTLWLVAGRWTGDARRGMLVARRVRQLDGEAKGRGALRDRLARRTDALFGARAPLVAALVFAPNAALDPEVRERYARSGLAHILSISGLHVGFLAAWLALILRKLGLSPGPRAGAAALLLVGYLWVLGFPAPATRAAVMLVADQVARLRQRVAAPRGVIALSALVVLFADPWALQSVGAWLSVAAIGAVIWADRAMARSPRVLRLLAPPAAATLVTAPVTAFAFGTVAPIGVVANLVAIPLAAVAVPGLAMALALPRIAAALSHLLAAGAGLGLALLDAVARLAASVPGGHVIMIAGWRAALLWAGVAAAAWWLWSSPRRPWLVGARCGFVVALVCWAPVVDTALGGASLDACRCLTVHFLDVGQGDAAALRTPAGRWVVVDGGPRTPESDAGRRVVIPFLRRHGASGLALVVATHGDADHLGGLPAVVRAFRPDVVLEPGEPLGRPLYLEFLGEVEAAGSRYHPGRAGDRIELDGVMLEVLSPDSTLLALPLDVNEHGVVLRVTYGAVRLLLQADAGLPVEARLAGRVGPVELLKVGHHGSRSATSDAWLSELAPREAVISVGRRNHYGHPAPEVLARLARHGVAILRTDESGTITFSTDGHGGRVRSHHD